MDPKVAIIATFRCGGTALSAAISRSYNAPIAFEPFFHPVNIPEELRPPPDLGSHLVHRPYELYNGRLVTSVAREFVNALYRGTDFIGLKTVCCSRSPTAVMRSGDALLFVSRKLSATYGSIMQEEWHELHSGVFHPLGDPLGKTWPEIARKVPTLSQYWVLRWMIHSYTALLLSDQGRLFPMIWVDEWDDPLRTKVADYLRRKLGPETGPSLEDTLGHPPPEQIKSTLGLDGKGDPTPMFWRPEHQRSQGRGYTTPMRTIAEILAASGNELLVELSNHIM